MERPGGHELNADQIAYWNGPAGQHWVDRQKMQDIVLAPISEILIERANAKVGERIVDVGCGCGATSLALAQKVGPSGNILGVDISAAMLNRARQVAPAGLPVEFALADATVYPFERAKFRPRGVAVRGDVFRGAGAVVRQSAPGAAAIRPAGVRLLARATGKSVFHGSASRGLQARPEIAAAGA